LNGITCEIKKFTSVKITEAISNNRQESKGQWLLGSFAKAGERNSNNLHNQFWQQHNHPIELKSNSITYQKLDYIHNNPVKAGIVLSLEDYLYSRALNYAGRPGALLDVILI